MSLRLRGKPFHPIIFACMYYLVYGFFYLFSLLPFWFMYLLSDGISFLLYYVIRYRRGVVKRNIAIAFPEKTMQERKKIERDFAQMAASGINTVRIPHTLPPRSLLDAAHRHGLFVMVGLSAEQYAGYLIDRERSPYIEELVRRKVRPNDPRSADPGRVRQGGLGCAIRDLCTGDTRHLRDCLVVEEAACC